MVWKFRPEQLQDPNKVGEYLKEKCCGNSREVQSYAMCWALATVYQTVFHTREHSQGEKEQGRARGTMGTPTAAEAQGQPMLGALAPLWKKTSKAKSIRLVRAEEEAGPSQQRKRQGQRRSPNPCPCVSCGISKKTSAASQESPWRPDCSSAGILRPTIWN